MLWKKALLARHALQARLGSGAKLENPSRGKVGMRGSNLARTETKIAFHGPLRLLREEAEADRQFVDASIARESSYSSAEVAKRVLQSLSLQSLSDDPGSASSAASACSASIVPVLAPGLLQKMTKLQLRQLATITPGFQRNKKTVAGKWIPKTSQEIAAGLLALPASASTQALPGLRVVRKRPASSVPRTRKALNT